MGGLKTIDIDLLVILMSLSSKLRCQQDWFLPETLTCGQLLETTESLGVAWLVATSPSLFWLLLLCPCLHVAFGFFSSAGLPSVAAVAVKGPHVCAWLWQAGELWRPWSHMHPQCLPEFGCLLFVVFFPVLTRVPSTHLQFSYASKSFFIVALVGGYPSSL